MIVKLTLSVDAGDIHLHTARLELKHAAEEQELVFLETRGQKIPAKLLKAEEVKS